MAASQVRVIAACLLTSLPGFGADIPVLSVCDVLQHLSAYRGKTVVVVGHTFDSFEGGILSGGCGGRKSVGIGGKQWPVAIFELGNRIPSKAGAFPVPLPELLAKKEALAPAVRAQIGDGLYFDNWDAVLSVIQSSKKLRAPKLPMAGNGYGANGSVAAGIVELKRVTLSYSGGGMFVKPKAPPPDLEPPPRIPLVQ